MKGIVLSIVMLLGFSVESDELGNNQQNSLLHSPVVVSAKGVPTSQGRISVVGKTNLPDKTKLLISLINEVTGFQAQDKTSVINGEYSTVPIGPKKGLNAGKYLIEVVMLIPATQPESVRKIIGDKGQHLKGSLVKKSSWGGVSVEYSTFHVIGLQKSISQNESVHITAISDIRRKIESLVKTGYSMDNLRVSSNLSDARKCGVLMRKNQEEVKQIQSKLKHLSLKYMHLKVAANEVYSCVSCSGRALNACVRVDDLLGQALAH